MRFSAPRFWSDIVGANASSYTTPPTLESDDDSKFRVVASNSAGSTTSGPATLVVCASGPVTVTHDPSFWDYNQYQRGTGGIFCPRGGATIQAHPGIPGASFVYMKETGISSTQEIVSISYDTATGAVIDLSYDLVTPTIQASWLCAADSNYYKPCKGVVVDVGAGWITFTNTVVGEQAGNFAIVLNGTLSFTPP